MNIGVKIAKCVNEIGYILKDENAELRGDIANQEALIERLEAELAALRSSAPYRYSLAGAIQQVADALKRAEIKGNKEPVLRMFCDASGCFIDWNMNKTITQFMTAAEAAAALGEPEAAAKERSVPVRRKIVEPAASDTHCTWCGETATKHACPGRSSAFYTPLPRLPETRKQAGEVDAVAPVAAEVEPQELVFPNNKCPKCGAWLAISRTADSDYNCDSCKHRWPIQNPVVDPTITAEEFAYAVDLVRAPAESPKPAFPHPDADAIWTGDEDDVSNYARIRDGELQCDYIASNSPNSVWLNVNEFRNKPTRIVIAARRAIAWAGAKEQPEPPATRVEPNPPVESPTRDAPGAPGDSEWEPVPNSQLGWTLERYNEVRPMRRKKDALGAPTSDRPDFAADNYWELQAKSILAERNAAIAELATLREELAAVKAERDRLQGFKTYMHKRLDEAGIQPCITASKDPNCRLGARLDELLAKMVELQREFERPSNLPKAFEPAEPEPPKEPVKCGQFERFQAWAVNHVGRLHHRDLVLLELIRCEEARR